MNISIIGAGSVGGNLARGWAKSGHALTLGVRNPSSEKLAPLLAETGAKAASVPDAGRAAVLPNLGGLAVTGDSSGAEQIQNAAPGARLVKCFNTTGANNVLAPRIRRHGHDALLRRRRRGEAVVRRLGEDLGFELVMPGRCPAPGCSSRWLSSGLRSPTRRAWGGRLPSACCGAESGDGKSA